jgi:DNA-binding transcriptional MerR regulator
MNTLTWFVGVGAAVVLFGLGAALGDVVSEEIRARLDRVPHALLRVAARRLAPELREENLAGWTADLHEFLRGAEALPVTRLLRGIRCALGALTAAHAISRALGARPPTVARAVGRLIRLVLRKPVRTGLSEPGYPGADASNVAGITPRQLDYWARTGLVMPSLRDPSGTGATGLYSFRDIVVLKVVKRLLDAGVSLQNIRKAIATVRQWGHDDLATMTLISDGSAVYECRTAEEVVDLLQSGQGVFGIVIGGAFTETEGSLAVIHPAKRQHGWLASRRRSTAHTGH